MRFHDIIPILYHGSNEAELKLLDPKPSALTDKPAVFAATYPEIAVAMSGHWTDDDFDFGRDLTPTDNPDMVPYVMTELSAGAFKQFFEGNTVFVYSLQSSTFRPAEHLQDFERVSFSAVAPFHKQEIKSPLAYLQRSKMVKLIPYSK